VFTARGMKHGRCFLPQAVNTV